MSMGRGNAAAPDGVDGDVIASARSDQGTLCDHGSSAICLGNDSEVSGSCITAGGVVSSPDECAAGADVYSLASRVVSQGSVET